MNLKDIGYAAEEIVAKQYAAMGYHIEQNFTIRGGELDIIAENDQELIFIEVKAVHHTDDLHNYVTSTKLAALQKTIQYYLRDHPTTKPISVDVAFVRGNTILDIYRNVTNT